MIPCSDGAKDEGRCVVGSSDHAGLHWINVCLSREREESDIRLRGLDRTDLSRHLAPHCIHRLPGPLGWLQSTGGAALDEGNRVIPIKGVLATRIWREHV